MSDSRNSMNSLALDSIPARKKLIPFGLNSTVPFNSRRMQHSRNGSRRSSLSGRSTNGSQQYSESRLSRFQGVRQRVRTLPSPSICPRKHQRLGNMDSNSWILPESSHPILVPLWPIWQIYPRPMSLFC